MGGRAASFSCWIHQWLLLLLLLLSTRDQDSQLHAGSQLQGDATCGIRCVQRLERRDDARVPRGAVWTGGHSPRVRVRIPPRRLSVRRRGSVPLLSDRRSAVSPADINPQPDKRKEARVWVKKTRCASGCVVECRICNREVAGSNLCLGYFAPRSTQPSIPSGSVNEYQLRLGRQRQVWLFRLRMNV